MHRDTLILGTYTFHHVDNNVVGESIVFPPGTLLVKRKNAQFQHNGIDITSKRFISLGDACLTIVGIFTRTRSFPEISNQSDHYMMVLRHDKLVMVQIHAGLIGDYKFVR